MEGTEQAGRNSSTGICILLIVTIPFLYILLLGPAIRWHDACPKPMQKVIEITYTPIIWLHENTPLEGPLEKYVELWER